MNKRTLTSMKKKMDSYGFVYCVLYFYGQHKNITKTTFYMNKTVKIPHNLKLRFLMNDDRNFQNDIFWFHLNLKKLHCFFFQNRIIMGVKIKYNVIG